MAASKPTPAAIRRGLIALGNEDRARIIAEVIGGIDRDDAVSLALSIVRSVNALGSAPILRPATQKVPVNA